ncbi:hypothetical protein [Pedobacter kyungheensis]|nr:hypothetical protein [Pedobacter kyungheensis]
MGRNIDKNFSITRALNLILVELVFLVFTVLIFAFKCFPSWRNVLPVIKRYSPVYFIILIAVFSLHYFLSKFLKELVNDEVQLNVYTKMPKAKQIVFSTLIVVFLLFLVVVIIKF